MIGVAVAERRSWVQFQDKNLMFT